MPEYNWEWFEEKINESITAKKERVSQYIDLTEDLDRITQTIVNREIGLYSERPQDFVVSIQLSRIFRLFISALELILSGYEDSAAALERTIWEVSIRLIYISEKNPKGGALGILLNSKEQELKAVKTELDYMKASGMDLQNLETNFNSLNAEYQKIKKHTKDLKFDPTGLVNKYGKISIGNMCESLKIRRAYDVTYNFLSGFVHENLRAMSEYVTLHNDRCDFLLGPIPYIEGKTQAGIYDLINTALKAYFAAASLIEDEEMKREVESLLTRSNGIDAV